mgnify:CR=1 FL=1
MTTGHAQDAEQPEMLAILEETPLKKIPSRKIPLSEGEDSDRSCRAQRWKQRRSSICKNGDPNASGGL